MLLKIKTDKSFKKDLLKMKKVTPMQQMILLIYKKLLLI